MHTTLRQRLILIHFTLIAGLLLSACQATPTVTPSPEASTPPTVASLPSPSASTSTPEPARDYPPLPTATLYKAPNSAPGVFTDVNTGIDIHYPPGWRTAPPDTGSDVLTWFLSPSSDVFAAIFAGTFGSGQTLESAAADIRDGTLTGLTNTQIISDKAITLDDGREAWSTIATGARQDGSQLKIDVTTTVNGSHTYTALVFGDST